MIRTAVLVLVAALAAPPLPAALAEVQISVRAEKEISVADADGVARTKRVEATRAVPGDEVIYTIAFTNAGEDPADDVHITNPIPEHLVLTGHDTGAEDARVTFSVDGGRSWDLRENLVIAAADGTTRPAAAADLTHIRWTLSQPLRPGDAGVVGFRAELQ